MTFELRKCIFWMLLLLATSTARAQDGDITALRTELDLLRREYDARISELEQRLAVAEQNARQANSRVSQMAQGEAPPAAPGRASAVGAGDSTFNPAIGVIFEGQAWSYGNDLDDYTIQGFPLGGEAGPVSEGLGLGETEIDVSANVDDKFTAWLTAPIVLEDGEAAIEVEEAWLETLALPAGISARFGRFFSAIGYLNEKHAHSWDFADQPLPYQALLGDQYIDDGVQLRWIAPTDRYVEVGGELLRGARYPAGGADHSGFGGKSLFVNVGGDLGDSHSWLAGLSYLDASSLDRPSGDEDDPLLFSGDAEVTIAEFVWKWAPNGNWKQRNFVFQSEIMWRNEDGQYMLPGMLPLPYDADQRGWYAQAVYQPRPQWRAGARIDGLSMDDPGLLFAGTPLAEPLDDPRRYSLMLDWSNSEFSRLRLQYTRDEAGLADDNQWGLQYILSIGAHGAHSF
jgi:hypothetical protein